MVFLRGSALWGYLRCVVERTGHNNMYCITDPPSRKYNDSKTTAHLLLEIRAATPSYWGSATSLVVGRTVSVIANHLESVNFSNYPLYVLAICFQDSTDATQSDSPLTSFLNLDLP